MLPPNLPLLHGNWVDLIIILVLLWFVVDGIGRGFLSGFLELLVFGGSFFLALKSYGLLSYLLVGNFSLTKGIADALGFLLAGFLSEVILAFLSQLLLEKLPKNILLYPGNRLLGFIPSFLNGLIVLAFFLTLLISLPISPVVKAGIESSRLGKPLVDKTQRLEQTLNNIFGGAVNDTLNFLTVNPQGSENINLHFTTANYSPDSAAEQTMFNYVNQQRVSRGIKPLVLDAKLQNLARAHDKDMFNRGYFSHYTPEGLSPFDRMKNAGISFEAAGENLAYAPGVDIADTGLMNSPGHRANILNPEFGKVGIGVINGGIYGEMFAQEFTN
ncbi:MAG: CvpA family protein [Patescibacteria group bacterium]|nr:CvpA family protein [Patescibacteria group bacterium]